MGATDTVYKYQKLPKEILVSNVEADRQEMLSEQGNDIYSGTWGAKPAGVKFHHSEASSYNEAYEICTTSDKWDEVIAVKVIDKKFTPKVFKSDSRILQLEAEMQTLKDEKKSLIGNFLSERQSKRTTVTCYACKTKTKADIVTVSKSCPKCKRGLFFLSATEVKRIATQNKRMKAIDNKIEARKRALKVDDKSIAKLEKEMSKLVSKWKEAVKQKKVVLKGFHTCKDCKSRINTDRIWDSEKKNVCPVCDSLLTNSSKRYTDYKILHQIEEIAQKLTDMKGEFWVVGGMCPY